MMSGIPRSGSSVLCSLINQHPQVHATTTSPVIELIDQMNRYWLNVSGRLKDPDSRQYLDIVKGVIYGAYEHLDTPYIVDKNRLWPRLAKQIHEALGYKLKIICTVRPIPEVLASYITLINKNADKVTFIDANLHELKLPINTKNRCKIIWENYVYHPYTSLRIAFNSPDIELYVCSYDQIVNDSQNTMNQVFDFIGVDQININSNTLQPMDENDEFHGGLHGLHEIRPILKRISPLPETIIGTDMVNLYKNMKLEFWNK